MLKISKLADYSSVIMTQLSANPQQSYSAATLAEATGIAVPTVSKLLKLLNDVNLVNSTRGANGGYQLARPAKEISVANIVAAIDGQLALTQCSLHTDECSHQDTCELRGNWQFINKLIVNVLQSVSLADMHQPLADKEFPIQFHGLSEKLQQKLNSAINPVGE